MKSSKLILLMICLLFLVSGCATVFSGWKQRIMVDSNPVHAIVFIDNVEIGKTPLSTKILRRKEHTVTIKLDGYKDYEIKLQKKVNVWVFGNIILGGGVGALIDLATGAIYKLTPDQIKAQFSERYVIENKKSDLYIAVSLDVDPSFEKIGQLELQ